MQKLALDYNVICVLCLMVGPTPNVILKIRQQIKGDGIHLEQFRLSIGNPTFTHPNHENSVGDTQGPEGRVSSK